MTPAQRVFAAMLDCEWWAPDLLAAEAKCTKAQVEVAIASFASAQMGGHYVERRATRKGKQIAGYWYKLHPSEKYAHLKRRRKPTLPRRT